MIRFSASLFFLIFTSLALSQTETSQESFSTAVRKLDYVPLKIDGEWVWYNIVKNKASDSIFITDCVYSESVYAPNYVVKDSTHWGILSGIGDTVNAFVYDSIIRLDRHLFSLKDNQWSYHHQDVFDGDTLIPVSFDSLFVVGDDVYIFDRGKTGIILRNGYVIPTQYDGIHEFYCHGQFNYDKRFISLKGNEYNLLNEIGEELLPSGIWDLRCTEDGVAEFRIEEHPEYFIPNTNEIVRPKGRDIIFYDDLSYKIYSKDNSKSELHLADGRILQDQYDDYFEISIGYIAVRKDGKIGLTKNGVDLFTEIKYDQINPLYTIQSGFQYDFENINFKFYQGDSCGLMDNSGQELFQPVFANIACTNDENRFIVWDDGKSGVVDRAGKIIIPIQYDVISIEFGAKYFIVQRNDKLGLFDFNGNQKTPIDYDGCRGLKTFGGEASVDALLVLSKNGKYYFANKKGFIDKNGFDHFNYSQEVLKAYDESAISVFLFDSQGKIEDRTNYPIYRNATIRKNYWDGLTKPSFGPTSVLEENQKEGYFGLRWFRKRGFGVKPTYRTIRKVAFSNDYFGSVDVVKSSYSLTDRTNAQVISGAHFLRLASGSADALTYFSSETTVMISGSGDRMIHRTADGEQHRAYSSFQVPETIYFDDHIHYSDYPDFNLNYRRYFKGGKAELVPIDSSDVSFYTYYRYLNSLDALEVSPQVMKMILNPKLGVRFTNSVCEVINASYDGVFSGYTSYRSVQQFKKYKYLSNNVFFEKRGEEEFGRVKTNYSSITDKKARSIQGVVDALAKEGKYKEENTSFILAKVKTNKLAKIHLDYPNYLFHQDSINLSYDAGRVTRRIDSNLVRLVNPNGRVLADSCIMIKYLKENSFAVLRSGGWQLIDQDGLPISDDWFSVVSEFRDGRAEFRYADGSTVQLTSSGEILQSLPVSQVFLDDNYYYLKGSPQLIYNRLSHVPDVMKRDEKYLSNGFFVSSALGETYVRSFGISESVRLKHDSKLKVFGTSLYYQKGKHFYSVDSNLVITKHKKVDKFREVTPEIGWLEGKKDQLIDSDWNYIHTMSKNQRFEMRGGDLVVLEGDSVFQNFGSMKSASDSIGLPDEPTTKVFFEDGKYGVKFGSDTILPLSYSWLSKINDQEFMTRIDSEQQLYDNQLNRIGSRPFDRFLETAWGNLVFFYQGEIFIYDRYRDKLTSIR